ncbi:MAG: LptA/OstA family protein [Candidatus Omnitrophica bacterium]|nr:LptA/OstA family protein [Candidatus Omnitrophota bacterium]
MSNKSYRRIYLPVFILTFILILNPSLGFSEEQKDSPIIINGDNVEYSTDNREVVATGNIEVIYKGSKLTCNKLKVNMQTKQGIAEGNAKLEDNKGVVTGDKIIYDFGNKTGIIYNANFRANPYFGKTKNMEKVNDSEFVARKGYFTTCNLDRPHYRFTAQKVSVFPGDKIRAQKALLYLGSVPTIYVPRFNYSMKEPIMHVQVEPGKSKDWGFYLLSIWRMNLTENVSGKAYLDYRSKLGWAEGLGLNYADTGFGKGDFKFYYTKEKQQFKSFISGESLNNTRDLLRWRHKWDIDPRTNFSAEFYKITDDRRKKDPSRNFLKDYFFREYEKDSQPLTYGLFHHSFNYSSLDILLQMRTNHWFDQIEKKPEINYTLPSLELGESLLYFENTSQLGNYDKKGSGMGDETNVARFDTKNTLSRPMKVYFLQFRPFVSSRQTLYDRGANGQSGIVRTIFYSGADLSTKFYRIFDVKSNFLNFDINGLRHIITPSVAYLYTHPATIPINNIRQIDAVDAINRGNTASLSLSNKLQTKRKGQSVDFVDLLITSDYVLDPKTGDNAILTNTGKELKDQLSDVLFKLKILPYSWMRLESEATFEHSDHDNVNYSKFSLINYDLIFDLGPERSISLGQRYERKGKNEITFGFDWRLSAKWKFGVYQRYNFKKTDYLIKGSQEQQFTLTRDLHCWEVELTFDRTKNMGSSLYVTFRLKAFPENEFGFDQSTSKKKSGTQ